MKNISLLSGRGFFLRHVRFVLQISKDFYFIATLQFCEKSLS